MNDPITIVLVEDHALTRLGLRTALEASGDMRVLAEASDGLSAEELILRERPNIAIVDIGLPRRDGIALTRAMVTMKYAIVRAEEFAADVRREGAQSRPEPEPEPEEATMPSGAP